MCVISLIISRNCTINEDASNFYTVLKCYVQQVCYLSTHGYFKHPVTVYDMQHITLKPYAPNIYWNEMDIMLTLNKF